MAKKYIRINPVSSLEQALYIVQSVDRFAKIDAPNTGNRVIVYSNDNVRFALTYKGIKWDKWQ